jgi:L-threonylcarbamoyladenylate synthase
LLDKKFDTIALGARLLAEGGVVAFPTETVYGLGADAFNVSAVERIFRIKGRPFNNPLIVHIGEPREAENLVAEVPPAARDLMDAFWPGPLTVVLPRRDSVPGLVTAGNPTVAVRVPDHPVALELIRRAGVPVAAPSANAFGRISPTTAWHVYRQLGNGPDLIIDGGPCRVGIESTVLGFRNGIPVLLRPGGVPAEQIVRVAGDLLFPDAEGRQTPANESPGMLRSHYAPHTPLFLVSVITEEMRKDPGAGFLLPGPDRGYFEGTVEVLSFGFDAEEGAAALYAALHRLDAAGLERIYALLHPDGGFGRAVNDRLAKASCGRSL